MDSVHVDDIFHFPPPLVIELARNRDGFSEIVQCNLQSKATKQSPIAFETDNPFVI